MQKPDLETQLRAAIRADGRSAYALERESGVPRPMISRFILGSRSITLRTAAKLARTLGLSLERHP